MIAAKPAFQIGGKSADDAIQNHISGKTEIVPQTFCYLLNRQNVAGFRPKRCPGIQWFVAVHPNHHGLHVLHEFQRFDHSRCVVQEILAPQTGVHTVFGFVARAEIGRGQIKTWIENPSSLTPFAVPTP